MRANRLRAEALALADDQHDDKGRHCGVDVNDRASCEIMRRGADRGGDRALCAQKAVVPHHVRHRRVVERDPQRHEQHPRAVLHALGDRAADQRHGDHRERDLERHVHAARVLVAVRGKAGGRVLTGAGVEHHRVLQQEPGRRVTENAADAAAGVCDRPAPQRPYDRGDRQGRRRQHQHVQHGFGAHHTAIEERHARRHEENQGCGCEHPCGITGVHRYLPLLFVPAAAHLDRAGSGSLPLHLTSPDRGINTTICNAR